MLLWFFQLHLTSDGLFTRHPTDPECQNASDGITNLGLRFLLMWARTAGQAPMNLKAVRKSVNVFLWSSVHVLSCDERQHHIASSVIWPQGAGDLFRAKDNFTCWYLLAHRFQIHKKTNYSVTTRERIAVFLMSTDTMQQWERDRSCYQTSARLPTELNK